MVKLSVVMAVYNGGAALHETLASIAAQSETDFELIVVDDGSTDATPRILAAFADPRLRVITQPNAGLTRALIRGCSEARAEVIARHDAGDRSHPDRFRRQLAMMESHVLAAAATRMLGPEGEELYVSRGNGAEIRESLLHADAKRIHGIPHHGSAMFRRADYLAAGGYRQPFRFAQDLDLWIRLAARGPIAVIDEVLYEARLEARSISSLHRAAQQRLTAIAVQLRDGGDEAALLDAAARVTSRRKARRRDEAAGLYFIAKCLRRRGDRTWRRYLLRALRRNPLHLRAWASLLLGR